MIPLIVIHNTQHYILLYADDVLVYLEDVDHCIAIQSVFLIDYLVELAICPEPT